MNVHLLDSIHLWISCVSKHHPTCHMHNLFFEPKLSISGVLKHISLNGYNIGLWHNKGITQLFLWYFENQFWKISCQLLKLHIYLNLQHILTRIASRSCFNFHAFTGSESYPFFTSSSIMAFFFLFSIVNIPSHFSTMNLQKENLSLG